MIDVSLTRRQSLHLWAGFADSAEITGRADLCKNQTIVLHEEVLPPPLWSAGMKKPQEPVLLRLLFGISRSEAEGRFDLSDDRLDQSRVGRRSLNSRFQRGFGRVIQG